MLPPDWSLPTSASFPARVPFSEGVSSHLRHHQAALRGPSARPRCHQLPGAASAALPGGRQLRAPRQRDPRQQRVGGRAARATVEEAPPEPDHLHGAPADGLGEEVPEAEVSLYPR